MTQGCSRGLGVASRREDPKETGREDPQKTGREDPPKNRERRSPKTGREDPKGTGGRGDPKGTGRGDPKGTGGREDPKEMRSCCPTLIAQPEGDTAGSRSLTAGLRGQRPLWTLTACGGLSNEPPSKGLRAAFLPK